MDNSVISGLNATNTMLGKTVLQSVQDKSQVIRYQDPPSQSRILQLDESSQEKSESGVGSSIQRDEELSHILHDKFNQSISDSPAKAKRRGRDPNTQMDRSAFVHGNKQLDVTQIKGDAANPNNALGYSKILGESIVGDQSALGNERAQGLANQGAEDGTRSQDSSVLIRVEQASEIQDRSILAADERIGDLTGLLGASAFEGEQRDVSGLNDVTNLNDATGLERLSSAEGSASGKERRSQELDQSDAKNKEEVSAEAERLSQQRFLQPRETSMM